MFRSMCFVDDMIDALEEYYECAGFSGIANDLLAMSEEDLICLYNSTYTEFGREQFEEFFYAA